MHTRGQERRVIIEQLIEGVTIAFTPSSNLHRLTANVAGLAVADGAWLSRLTSTSRSSANGSTSTTITREIYTHVTPPMQTDAAERVAGLIVSP